MPENISFATKGVTIENFKILLVRRKPHSIFILIYLYLYEIYSKSFGLV